MLAPPPGAGKTNLPERQDLYIKTKAQFSEDLAGSAFSGTSAYKVGCGPISSFAVLGWSRDQQLLGQGGLATGSSLPLAPCSSFLPPAGHTVHSACPQSPIQALAEWPPCSIDLALHLHCSLGLEPHCHSSLHSPCQSPPLYLHWPAVQRGKGQRPAGFYALGPGHICALTEAILHTETGFFLGGGADFS